MWSLDNSFVTLALLIQERPDFKDLDPSDILERLNTHEFQLSEKRDIYGPNYGRTRALKAKVVSSSEEEYGCSSGDPEDVSASSATPSGFGVLTTNLVEGLMCLWEL